jgi:hypothetical protein
MRDVCAARQIEAALVGKELLVALSSRDRKLPLTREQFLDQFVDLLRDAILAQRGADPLPRPRKVNCFGEFDIFRDKCRGFGSFG